MPPFGGHSATSRLVNSIVKRLSRRVDPGEREEYGGPRDVISLSLSLRPWQRARPGGGAGKEPSQKPSQTHEQLPYKPPVARDRRQLAHRRPLRRVARQRHQPARATST